MTGLLRASRRAGAEYTFGPLDMQSMMSWTTGTNLGIMKYQMMGT